MRFFQHCKKPKSWPRCITEITQGKRVDTPGITSGSKSPVKNTKNSKEYVLLESAQADAPGRRPAAPQAAGPIPVKKVPLDGWVEQSEPAGVPPPAYDQVSIHSIQKQKTPDPAEQPLSGAETSSPSPTNEQK
ncbi:hypothetical protein Y032_0494g2456 [Ancylostoma ceylanicum]|uniref:Uncharacterized protein n=1 Tax=Ancylostoma ceylanicum TaxID=53326 RepID=A0A016WVZ4_9BILA|nr:hypothetical protein Y032_0494g2456 [Ancylostoma ceylanicum]